MHSTTVTTHAMTMRTVPIARPGNGASSRRRNASSCGSRSAGSGAVSARSIRQEIGARWRFCLSLISEDDRHGRGADAEGVGRLRVVDVDAHGEALRDVDPVELAPKGGDPGRDALVLRIHRPADALDRAPESPAWIGHEVDLGRHARGNAIELRLAV